MFLFITVASTIEKLNVSINIQKVQVYINYTSLRDSQL